MAPSNILKGNAIIGQSGGPTTVINQSLVGAVQEARRLDGITGFYGAVHGVEGMLNENFIDLFAESDGTLNLLAQTPSAGLGSVRKKPTADDCSKIFNVLKVHDIRYFFYIGGNDTAETANIIAKLAGEDSYDLRVFHIPKTIDNDLRVTDHCPGYGSAAKFVAMALMGDNLDNRALQGVKIDVIMGRHAGFLTAATALGRASEQDGPHLVYVPEVPFSLDSFKNDVENTIAKHGRCLITVSEGIADSEGNPIFQSGEKDSHGNVQLSGSGALGDYLADIIKRDLKAKRVRADTFGYLQRCFPAIVSEVDSSEAYEAGAVAVRAAAAGAEISGSVAIRRTGNAPEYRSEFFITPLETVAKHTRQMERNMLNEAGNNISDKFVEYALPLVGKLPEIGRLKLIKIDKKLG